MEGSNGSIGALALNRSFIEDSRSNETVKRYLNLVNGKVRIYEVVTAQELEAFIDFKEEIHMNNPVWPGQDKEEQLSYFSVTSPYASYIEFKPFIAVRDGQTIGRICAIINDHHNQRWGDNIGFFGFFECINDQSIANDLLATAESYLASKGRTAMYGPITPTIQDEVGILLDSYDKVPGKGLAYNPPYYPELLHNYGLSKFKDMLHPVVSADNFRKALDAKMHKIQPFLDDSNLYARYFDWNNIERDAEIVRDLFYYQTFWNHWGYYPAEPEEWCKMLENYRPYINEDQFLIVEDAGEPIGFTLCFIDENQEMHANKLGYTVEKKRQKWDLIGIKPDYHRNGLGTFIAYNMMPSLAVHNTEELAVSWVLEDNANSLGLCKSLGMTIESTYRIFYKEF